MTHSGEAHISIISYGARVARYFVKRGLGLRAMSAAPIPGIPFRAFIRRNGTLYAVFRNSVVVAIRGNAGPADKIALASRLESASLARLARRVVTAGYLDESC